MDAAAPPPPKAEASTLGLRAGLGSPARARRAPGGDPRFAVREAEAEKLAALRRHVAEARLKRDRDAQRTLLQQQELVEDWKRQCDRKAADAREARERRLARLQSSLLHSSHRSDLERSVLSCGEDCKELMERYGDRLRVPMPLAMSPRLEEPSVSMSSSRSPRKPLVCPSPLSNRQSRARLRRSGIAAAGLSAAVSGASNVGLTPRMSMAVSAESGAPGSLATLPSSIGRPTLSVALELGELEVSEPDRSLMPRKELLRKKQSELLKRAGVVFYKEEMRRHFQKILEAVELTFSETLQRGQDINRREAALSLGKPILDSPRAVLSARQQ